MVKTIPLGPGHTATIDTSKVGVRRGFPFTQAEVIKVAPELLKLQQRTGKLDAADIVKAARSKGTALHRIIFKKTDSEAADIYRLEIARKLWSAITFHVEVHRQHQPSVAYECAAFVRPSLSVPGSGQPDGAVLVTDVMGGGGLTKQYRDRALMDLEAWEKRYAVVLGIDQSVQQPLSLIRQILKSI